MKKLTNVKGLPLELALWLGHDEYEHDDSVISVTGLLKPIKEIILSQRITDQPPEDVGNMVASRLGTAIHTAIEASWMSPKRNDILKSLGFPKGLIDTIRVNPSEKDIAAANKAGEDITAIYLEQRSKKKIDGIVVSGQYDMVVDGAVKDVKTTSTYSYGDPVKAGKYVLQGSIYRWLNPKIITSELMSILYVFKNWSAAQVQADPKYPANDVLEVKYELLSLADTERYIRNKLQDIRKYIDSPEKAMPECTPEDLWMSASVFKYYKNPAKTARSTKNFDTRIEANKRFVKDGSVGIVKEIKGTAKACRYCAAVSICEQAKSLILQERLVL